MKTVTAILFFILSSGIAVAGDERAINEQLQNGGTVHLASGVYNIESSIQIYSNTVLTGEPDTILRVSSSAGQWFVDGVGVVDNADTSLHDVEISGFQIDGNLRQLPQSYANSGSGNHNAERLIDFRCDSGSNISIHDMKLYDAYSDGIHIAFANDVNCYNNFVSDCQHSGIYFISVVNGLVENNEVAGITSDCLRFDNCVDSIFRYNTLYSYSGDSNGAYEGGQNGVQIADQGYSHGGGSDKPTTTINIEGYGNVFSSDGLRTIWLDSSGKGVTNVYLHNNKGTDVSTSGTSVTGINVSFDNPPTKEMSEKVFSNIFDILNTSFFDNGRTEQTIDSINYSVKKTENGIVAGGIKIIGFKDKIVWNNETYIPDENSVLCKAEAVKSPSFSFDIDKIEKNVAVKIENGTATATMKVTTSYFKKKSNKKSVVTFNDSCPAPKILERQTNVTGTVYQYPNRFVVSVPSSGLTTVHYTYNGSFADHFYAVGERQIDEKGVQYTNFSDLEYWRGNLQHEGKFLSVIDSFDRSKLNVTVTTPYEKLEVKEFNVVKKDFPKELISSWFYPEVVFLALCTIFGLWLKWQIF